MLFLLGNGRVRHRGNGVFRIAAYWSGATAAEAWTWWVSQLRAELTRCGWPSVLGEGGFSQFGVLLSTGLVDGLSAKPGASLAGRAGPWRTVDGPSSVEGPRLASVVQAGGKLFHRWLAGRG